MTYCQTFHSHDNFSLLPHTIFVFSLVLLLQANSISNFLYLLIWAYEEVFYKSSIFPERAYKLKRQDSEKGNWSTERLSDFLQSHPVGQWLSQGKNKPQVFRSFGGGCITVVPKSPHHEQRHHCTGCCTDSLTLTQYPIPTDSLL